MYNEPQTELPLEVEQFNLALDEDQGYTIMHGTKVVRWYLTPSEVDAALKKLGPGHTVRRGRPS